MIRKIALIYIFILIVTYFTLLGLFGQEGFFHARSTKAELELLRQRQEVLLLQVDSLEQQKKLMSSQDALKDAAFRFGYQVEGEQVFYFTDDDQGDSVRQERDSIPKVENRAFAGFPKLWIALMALVFSFLFTVVYVLVKQRSVRHR